MLRASVNIHHPALQDEHDSLKGHLKDFMSLLFTFDFLPQYVHFLDILLSSHCPVMSQSSVGRQMWTLEAFLNHKELLIYPITSIKTNIHLGGWLMLKGLAHPQNILKQRPHILPLYSSTLIPTLISWWYNIGCYHCLWWMEVSISFSPNSE